ncbi:MAG TPA: bifunctional phosphopantothenoylcysteine decarboxylase/phosphopantothenate--cysteine ligase CoaBC [Solirubrobacteraceae bacterium]|nr:bifunctional phosphopantothenoylcysteine decarboxylase/phosphopantothenate--cysteine ligase CoaBC [Solirubrobacteraceae bacterium]
MARVLIGVTGGIAAYKTVQTVRQLIGAGHAVRVIETPNGRRFVGAQTFAGITGAPVLSDEFEDDPMRGAYPGEAIAERAPIAHLALAQRADLYLIAPASANTIAKLAHGLADNLVTAAALAADCPLLLAPAMNDRMYAHAATQDNLALLRSRGALTVGPDAGELASHGEHGLGRMAEPEAIVDACERLLAGPVAGSPAGPDWRGVRVLVSAGGTREPIDPVRYIGNRSSGRMGLELAAAAARRGADVTLVAANVSLPAPAGVRLVEVQTAAELLDACEARFDAADVLMMAAAVADFRPRAAAAAKLKKDAGPPLLELEPTADVLGTLSARRRPGQVLVGFAAETGEGAVGYGRSKLDRKRLDAIVVNDVADARIGFDSADNEVTIVTAGGAERKLARAGKDVIAEGVLAVIDQLLSEGGREDVGLRAGPYRTTGV